MKSRDSVVWALIPLRLGNERKINLIAENWLRFQIDTTYNIAFQTLETRVIICKAENIGVIVAITFGSDENPAIRALMRPYSERRRVVVLRS
jgi:hypothetical protein